MLTMTQKNHQSKQTANSNRGFSNDPEVNLLLCMTSYGRSSKIGRLLLSLGSYSAKAGYVISIATAVYRLQVVPLPVWSSLPWRSGMQTPFHEIFQAW